MLVVGCWLLDVGCWMLVVGCWLLDVGCSISCRHEIFGKRKGFFIVIWRCRTNGAAPPSLLELHDNPVGLAKRAPFNVRIHKNYVCLAVGLMKPSAVFVTH